MINLETLPHEQPAPLRQSQDSIGRIKLRIPSPPQAYTSPRHDIKLRAPVVILNCLITHPFNIPNSAEVLIMSSGHASFHLYERVYNSTAAFSSAGTPL